MQCYMGSDKVRNNRFVSVIKSIMNNTYITTEGRILKICEPLTNAKARTGKYRYIKQASPCSSPLVSPSSKMSVLHTYREFKVTKMHQIRV
jgi:hypothetical protein